MPYTPINFANIEPIKYGNAFSDILSGYKLKEDAEDRRLKNEGTQYNNTIKGAEALYANDANKFATLLKQKQAENYEKKLESDIGLNKAHENYYNNQANALDTSMPYGEEVEGSLNRLPKNEQVAITKDMNSDLRRMQELIEVEKEVKQFLEINRKFPKMNESFQALLLNGGENPGMISQLAKKFNLKPKEYEALTQAQKIANSIALRMARSGQIGNGKYTDYIARLVQSTKPSPLYPNPTNEMIAQNILEEITYAKPHAEKLAKGLKHRFAVYPDYQQYKNQPQEKDKAEALSKNASPDNAVQGGGMIKIKTSNGEYDIPREELNEFLKEFPDAVEIK